MALKAKAHGTPIEKIITMCSWNGTKPEGVYTFDEVIALGKGKVSDEEIEKR